MVPGQTTFLALAKLTIQELQTHEIWTIQYISSCFQSKRSDPRFRPSCSVAKSGGRISHVFLRALDVFVLFQRYVEYLICSYLLIV
jgi:hypothetical protein